MFFPVDVQPESDFVRGQTPVHGDELSFFIWWFVALSAIVITARQSIQFRRRTQVQPHQELCLRFVFRGHVLGPAVLGRSAEQFPRQAIGWVVKRVFPAVRPFASCSRWHVATPPGGRTRAGLRFNPCRQKFVAKCFPCSAVMFPGQFVEVVVRQQETAMAFQTVGQLSVFFIYSLPCRRLAPLSFAVSLSKHKGDLYLYRVTELTDAAVESLSKHEGGWLGLGGLTELSDAAIESLSKHQGGIRLGGLTELTDAAAESLSKHKGDLELGGLTELSDAAAESLSRHEGGCLDLPSLTELSDAAAESLSRHKGDLWPPALTELPESAAAILRKHPSIAAED